MEPITFDHFCFNKISSGLIQGFYQAQVLLLSGALPLETHWALRKSTTDPPDGVPGPALVRWAIGQEDEFGLQVPRVVVGRVEVGDEPRWDPQAANNWTNRRQINLFYQSASPTGGVRVRSYRCSGRQRTPSTERRRQEHQCFGTEEEFWHFLSRMLGLCPWRNPPPSFQSAHRYHPESWSEDRQDPQLI